MAAADWVHWDEEKQEYGYWLETGPTWVPCEYPVPGTGEDYE